MAGILILVVAYRIWSTQLISSRLIEAEAREIDDVHLGVRRALADLVNAEPRIFVAYATVVGIDAR